MKTIIQAMLEEIYTTATKVSQDGNQTVGASNNFYITLEQLEAILKEYEG